MHVLTRVPGSSDTGSSDTSASDRRRNPWPERIGLVLVAIACVAAFVIWPVGPTYDLAHQLLWGRDIADGRLPELDAFRAPTQHPLTLLLGVSLAPFGDGDVGGRIAVGLCLISFVAMVAGVFSLAQTLFGRLVAWATALLVLSRMDYAALAIRSYLDIPYLALLVWAAALEARRPRRGGAVWVLLIAAGLLRPEAWLLLGLYGLWMISGLPRPWTVRAVSPIVALAGSATAIWVLTDLVLTGHPLFSLTYTSGSAAELQHQGSLLDVPELVGRFVTKILKWPVLVACLIGVALAVWREPRRSVLPLTFVLSGIVTFALIVGAGLAAIDRYLVVSALGLQFFGGYALAGWSRAPERSGLRRWWMVGAAILAVAGIAFAATHTSFTYIRKDLDTRVQIPDRLQEILEAPAVVAARRCGPVTVPNQKLIPDVRLVLGGARASEVLARSDPRARNVTTGVALTIERRELTWHPAYTPFGQGRDPRSTALPPTGFRRVADDGWFAAHVRC